MKNWTNTLLPDAAFSVQILTWADLIANSPSMYFWLAFCWVRSQSWATRSRGRTKSRTAATRVEIWKGVVSYYSWSCLVVGCLISFPLPARVAKESISCQPCQLFVLSAWCFSETFSSREGLKTLFGFCSGLEKNFRMPHQLKVQRFCHSNWNLWLHLCSKWEHSWIPELSCLCC